MAYYSLETFIYAHFVANGMKVWKCTIMDGNKWKSYYFILHLVLCFFASLEIPCKARIALSANKLWFWPKWNKILYKITWHRWNYNVWDRSGFSATELYIFCLLLFKFWAIFLFEKTLRNEFLEFSLALFFLYWCVFFFVFFTFATFPLLEVDEIRMSPAYVNKYFLK